MAHPFEHDQDLKNIYTKMLEWLSVGEVSEKRLVDRIVRLKRLYPDTVRYAFYTEKNAKIVVDYLREQDLVNDQRYTERLFELLKDKKDGLRAIRRKMLNRQLPKSAVDAVLKDFHQSGGKQDLERITAAATAKLAKLQSKYGNDPKKKYQIRSKLYAWLAMRGFGPEESSLVLKRLAKIDD